MEKIAKKDLQSQSADIVTENIEKLQALFPEIITEGDGEKKIDFDALKEVLGEYVEDKEERYNFSWYGKSRARRLAQTPSTGTLRPCKEESVDWDTTQNLFIEGDNLEVLKLLQKSYHKKVKMIYIDPPYNTGNEFIYPDKYQDNLDTYLRYTGQIDDEGLKISANSETIGRYHTNWLNMMYPRLKLARNLLQEDGVIFISIDDGEVASLRKVCDDIFCEDNFIANIIWQGGRKNDAKRFSVVHDYILVYVKNDNYLKENQVKWRERKAGLDVVYDKANELISKYSDDYVSASQELTEWFNSLGEGNPAKEHSHYKKIDDQGVYYGDNISSPNYRENLIFDYKGYKPPKNGWRYNLEAMKRLDGDGLLIFPESKSSRIQYKRYLHHTGTWAPSTCFYKDRRAASKSLSVLLDGDFFDFPKDVGVLSRFIETFTDSNDVVLDFFAGSSATAHACLEVNAIKDTKNRFIMVQLPELCDEKSEAFKSGYKSISEISKERIRRASTKIKEENLDYEGDLGFRVFKLDATNINPWDADFETLEEELALSIDSIKADRTPEDVLYEILLKYGLDLTLPIEQHEIDGKTVYDVGMGALMVCLDDNISIEVVEGIGKLKEELQPELMRVVFKDAGFADDVVKTNTVQVLKQFGIDDVRSI